MKTRILPGMLTGLLALAAAVSPPLAAQTAPKDPAEGWNEVYRDPDSSYVREPSSFLVRCLDRMAREGLGKPGAKALVLAMGAGRNAVELAARGYDVTGLDISEVGIEKAEASAAAKGVEIRAVRADMFKNDLGDGVWDLVTNIYFNPAIRILDRIKRAVRPGGFLIIEGFGADYEGPGPPIWSRYGSNQLLDELEGWRILEYQDGTYSGDWAGGKPVPIVRVLASKPKP
jgi:SAM-dependent methyltransferase